MFYNFNRTGKGINPDAPKKEGFALFLDILYREFWPMVGLNLLFLLSCLPVVTIGAANAAMHTLLMRMVRDKPVDVAHDFRYAFKENFKGGTGIFVIQVVVIWALMVNFHFYGTMNPYIQSATQVFGVLLIFVNLYLMPVLVSVEIPLLHVVKNSFFLVFLNLKYTLPLGILTLLVYFLNIWFIPYSILPNLLFGIVFLNFITCFCCYYGIEKYCYGTHEAEIQAELEEKMAKKKKTLEEEEMEQLDAELEALKKEAEELSEEN